MAAARVVASVPTASLCFNGLWEKQLLRGRKEEEEESLVCSGKSFEVLQQILSYMNRV